MRVTYDWLKDFVEIKIPPKALADKLTMAGLEVTTFEECDGDFIFELEVTSNRPDLLSVIGIAREVAAITNSKLKVSEHKSTRAQTAQHPTPFSIENKDKNDCPLYTAKIIRGVKVGPAPAWMRKRLELIGCRSVNNVVDITNYILFTWGESLHAFDFDKLDSDTIVVRRGEFNEAIITIDAEQRLLTTDILVIADKQKPVAIAGIMGGKDTEVTESTKNILLEAAVFNPLIIRRARQKLGVQTDSSYRFERGIDFETVERASFEAAKLISEIAGGNCVLSKSSPKARPNCRMVNLNVLTVSKVLGAGIKAQKIKKILTGLGFKVKAKPGNNFTITVPGYRQDVGLEIDLIEEIGRVFGYEYIPISIPSIRPQQITEQPGSFSGFPTAHTIKNILIGLGLNEVITYSLIDRNLLKDFSMSALKPVEILNPLSKEQEILRPTIMPSLVRCIAYNLNQKQSYVNIFEIAKIFTAISPAAPKEELVLGIALCGEKSMLHETGLIKEKMGLLHLKGILEVLFERLGTNKYNFNLVNTYEGSVCLEEGKVGLITKLQKNTLNNLGIKNKDVVVAEISLEKIFPFVNLKKRFSDLPLYPGISRDISVVIGEDIRIKDILLTIKEKTGDLLREAKVVDYYRGAQIPAGFRGLTISCLYRSDERTLTDAGINPLHSSICAALVDKFGAKIR